MDSRKLIDLDISSTTNLILSFPSSDPGLGRLGLHYGAGLIEGPGEKGIDTLTVQVRIPIRVPV